MAFQTIDNPQNAGEPKLSRRAVLAGAGAAALSSTAVLADPAPSPLHGLIEAHRRAWAAYDAALCVEGDFEEEGFKKRRELFVMLKMGGGQSVHASEDLAEAAQTLREAIAARYEREIKLAPLERISPQLAEQAKAALRKAQADDLRAMRAVIREEQDRREQSGYAQAIRNREATCDAENEAMHALASYRCTSLHEVETRARYIKEFHDTIGCLMQEEHLDALLESMSPEAA